MHGHAVRRANGELAVLLLNEDPDNAQQVALSYPGYHPPPASPTVYTYLNGGDRGHQARTGSATAQTLPAYSLTTVDPAAASCRCPCRRPPGTPDVSAVTDTTRP